MPNKRPPSAKPNKRQPFRFSFGDNDFSTRKSTSNHLKDELNNLIKGNKNLKNVLEAIETFTKNLWNEKFCPGMLSSMNFGYRKKSKKSQNRFLSHNFF